MASLVQELQRDAIGQTVSASELLRKALVVARKLGIKEFAEWIELELRAYPSDTKLPEYRVLKGRIMAQNPVRGWIPVINTSNPEWFEQAARRGTNQSIGEIESLVEGKKSGSGDFVMFYPDGSFVVQDPFPIALHVGHAQLHGVIEAVRNIVLDWSLKLEEDGIIGDDMTFSKEEKQLASSQSYHIETYIEQMSHSQIQQNTKHSTQTLGVQTLDLKSVSQLVHSLKSLMGKLGLNAEQESELNADIRTVESQLASPKPKAAVIRESLHSIRNVLEGAAGSGLATGIIYEIARLLQ
jgi:hypothetical protein